MAKSADAFRTISEVAEWLGVQTHVLRFWESKFSQVRPVKRAGGRRYYRPADMLLIGGIRKLLHEDGLTIKGAQKVLREEGVLYVADLSQPLDDLTSAELDDDLAPSGEQAQSVTEAFEDKQPELPLQNFTPAPTPAPANPAAPPPIVAEPVEPMVPMSTNVSVEVGPEEVAPEPVGTTETAPPVQAEAAPVDGVSESDSLESIPFEASAQHETRTPVPEPAVLSDPSAADVGAPVTAEASTPAQEAESLPDAPAQASADDPEQTTPRPAQVDVPADLLHDEIEVSPGLLSHATSRPSLDASARAAVPGLREKLSQLRDRMAKSPPPSA